MARILFFLVLAALAWIVYKSWKRKQLDQSPESKPLPGKQQQVAIMSCKHCGAFSPLTEGIMIEGRYYCNKDHALAEGEKLG
jgi:cbb3-type cytochrome oxidase subunit 3